MYKRYLKYSLRLIMALYLFACCFVIYDGLSKSIQSAEIGIVYGNQVLHDGTPSPRLMARLDKAIELYSSKTIEKILVSGGVGDSGFDEATIMANYLQQSGVETNDILLDSAGMNTHLTAMNALNILGDPNVSILGISQYFHLTRVELSLHQAGFNNVSSISADFFEWRDIYSIVREIPALVKYFLFYG